MQLFSGLDSGKQDVWPHYGKYALLCVVYTEITSSEALKNVWKKDLWTKAVRWKQTISQMTTYWLNVCTLASLVITVLTTEKQFLAHQQKQCPRGCLSFSSTKTKTKTQFCRYCLCRWSVDTVLTCPTGLQHNTRRSNSKADYVIVKMDAVVKWLTVSLALLIVQLHHSQPTYEHIMNDEFQLDEFSACLWYWGLSLPRPHPLCAYSPPPPPLLSCHSEITGSIFSKHIGTPMSLICWFCISDWCVNNFVASCFHHEKDVLIEWLREWCLEVIVLISCVYQMSTMFTHRKMCAWVCFQEQCIQLWEKGTTFENWAQLQVFLVREVF